MVLDRIKTIAGSLITAGLFSLAACSGEKPTPPPPPTAAEKLAKLKKEVAFQRVVAILKELKRSQRDPDSLVWEDISATEDASVMCIAYRSRNGFGGMNKSVLVVANKKAFDKPAAWNKHCAGKSFVDFMYARVAV